MDQADLPSAATAQGVKEGYGRFNLWFFATFAFLPYKNFSGLAKRAPFKVSPFHAATILVLVVFEVLRWLLQHGRKTTADLPTREARLRFASVSRRDEAAL
jgi:hypothetical protein